MGEGGTGQRRNFAVVGIGASAGGLEALEQFFAAVPKDSGLAYVVVQHLERRHPSLLADLLGRCTQVPVATVTEGEPLAANRVFIIPPNATLTVSDGVLHLAAPSDEPRMPIDTFLKSLAQDGGELAAGVLLSGTGTDGTFGMRAIKEQGGLTLAQTPETAKHPSMPQHAIAAGFVDEVLAVAQMPARLLKHIEHLERGARSNAEREAEVRELLDKICDLLRRSTGHDFGRYKEGTLLRRIRRRIQLLQIESTAEYLKRLAQDPEEPRLLLRDLLIGVTQFFREPAAFGALAETVIPLLLESSNAERPVRIWVPGCATGEEVYSLAILLEEQLAAKGTTRHVQLFATDIDTEALAAARSGNYRADIAEQVSPERLERFFTRTGGGYQVVKDLRDMCVFSAHNLIRDPPFSSLDLISCRNLLIYLEPELQRKVIPLLHYALRRSGFLFLGSSEELSGHYELFEPIDKKHRIFQRKETLVRPALDFPLGGPSTSRGTISPATPERGGGNPKQAVLMAFERMLLERFAPAAAIVDERGEMLCVSGRRGPVLQLPAGLVTNNLLDHAAGTLRHTLRTTLADAVAKHEEIGACEVITDVRGAPHRLQVTVGPAPGVPAQSGLYAVVIEDLGSARASSGDAAQALAHEPMIDQLESELKTTRADLQATNEELEGAIEELKSSNEELLSTNEELQSANEELQTSKEELQSVNEELETVNSELRQKVHELGVANSDLQNLFTSTQVATIFLDRELKLAKFTPAATSLFHFIDADVGRPLSDLAPRFAGTDLLADVTEVLRTLAPVEREIRAGEAWFILRVLPYRTLDDAIAGAVVTFADVTKLKRAEAALRESERLLKDVIDGSPSLVYLKDLQGRFLTINKRLEAMLGLTREQVRGKTDLDLFPRERAESNRANDRKVAESHGAIDVEESADLADGRHVLLASKFPLLDSSGHIYGVGGISHDITERKWAEEALKTSEESLRFVLSSCQIGAWDMDIADHTTIRSPEHDRIYGYDSPLPKWTYEMWLDHIVPEDRARADAVYQDAVRTQSDWSHEFRIRRPDGQIRWIWANGSHKRDADGKVRRVAGTVQDISESKRRAERVGQLSRLYDVLSKVNETIVRTRDEKALYRDVCQIIADRGNFPLAWIGLLEKNGTVTPAASAGSEASYVQGIGVEVDGKLGQGPTGSCIREGRPVVNDDFATNPVMEPWREAALRRGFGASAAFPLRKQGQVVGSLTVYSSRPGTFDAQQVNLLEALSADISYALDALDAERQRIEAEQALRHSESNLREADRRKNDFLAMLSHELRNPLAPIKNSLYVLAHGSPDAQRIERAHSIMHRQVTHLVRLIDDLLDVTRISSGKVRLEKEPLDLSEVVERTVEDHRSMFAAAEIALTCRVQPGLSMEADRTRVAQMVGNLLQNAVKFTPEGGKVSVSLEGSGGRQAIIRVRDSGVGMSTEMIQRLFQPFAQAEQTLDRTKGGLGLGLSLVKGLVELHGGSVAARSGGPGEGAEFEISLPIASPAAPQAGTAAASRAPKPATASRRVLIIEDNHDAADSLREALEIDNHTVAVAYSALEGLQKARTFHPDVVLCDVGLPEMDGYELARTMRADAALAGTLLVALTGYAGPEDIAKSQEAGFNLHIAKPPSIEALERVLTQVRGTK